MSALEIPTEALWLPGQGMVPAHVRQAMQAVEEYDSDLSLGRHEQTGDWVVLLKRGPMEKPHPVFGLGRELPAPERIKEMLYKSDVRRHGAELARKINKAQEMRQEQFKKDLAEQTGEAAEALESFLHRDGRTPYKRVFIPKGV